MDASEHPTHDASTLAQPFMQALRVNATLHLTEAKGKNGWYRLARLVISLRERGTTTVDPYIRLEGYSKRSGWNAPWALETDDPEVLRWLGVYLLDAAEVLEKAQGQQKEE